MLFSHYLEIRVKGNEKKLPTFFYDKEKTYQYCVKNNIRIVRKLEMFNRTDELESWFNSTPEEFVIKPSFLSSMIGVMVLKKINEDLFYESLSQRNLSKSSILSSQINFFDKSNKVDKHIVIEEKIVDKYIAGIPLDYKVYIFYNKIAVIGLFNRNSSKLYVDWYDGNFQPLKDGLIINQAPYTYQSETLLEISIEDKQSIIDFSLATAEKIKSPFLSLDIYLSDSGPVLGEVTLAPGGFYFQKMYKVSNELQVRMGRMWEDAQLLISEAM